MDTEVDIIEFRVPTEATKTLFVWDIQPTFSPAFIYESIWTEFSEFGPLYLLKLFPNAAVTKPGFYALVKFFSAAQASRAQRAMHGRGLFQHTPLNVKQSSRGPAAPSYLSPCRPLSHSSCQDLANHYLGFNGWSTHILTLKDLSSSEAPGPEGWSRQTDPQESSLKYGCLVEVTFPHHGLSCRGVGVAEEAFQSTEVVLPQRRKLQRWARDKAVVDAMEKVLLLVLGSGRVMVELRVERDQVLPEEDLEGVIQVNDVPWSQFDPEGAEEEEEVPCDLTV